MKRLYRMLILTKSVDGGTGTFVLSLNKIQRLVYPQKFKIQVASLEEPKFRDVDKRNFFFLRKKNSYPEVYSFSLRNLIYFLQELFYVRRFIKTFNPHVIVSVDLHCNLLTSINKLLFFREKKIILTTHNNLEATIDAKSSSVLSYFLRFSIHFLYNRAESLVSISEELAEDIQKHFKINKHIYTIHYGNRIYSRNTKDRDKKNNIILSVGRLVEQKDFQTLLKAFKQTHHQLPKCELWIIGDGYQKNSLQAYVQKNGLIDCVKFLGWQQDIIPFLKKSKIFVLSSKREGFSYVLIEAMSQGIPVISADAPYGPSEILEKGKYGLLFKVGDGRRLKKHMLTLLLNNSKYRYFVKKALERSEFFSEEQMIQNYYKLISDMVKQSL